MSHFTVLVAASSDTDLAAKLQPFHEYECTGIKDQYVQFVECDLRKCRTEFRERESDYSGFDEFMQDWYGYEFLDGKWGRWTNPNKKWDWWTIGGRWSGLLKTKDGKKLDMATVGYVDWQAMKADRVGQARDKYEAFHKAKELPEKEANQLLWDLGLLMLGEAEKEMLESLSLDEYLQKAGSEPLTFAWIGLDGAWRQRAEMGWWGIAHNKNENAGSEFWAFVKSLPSNQRVYVIDCHI